MLRLYVVRHGKTIWNEEKRLQGWGDSKLTNKGQENATLLGEYLKDIDFEAAYSSTSSRAYDTAEIIKGKRSLKVNKLEDLREISFGSWEGKKVEDIEKSQPERFYNFWKKPHLYKKDTGEDFQQVRIRLKKILDLVINNHDHGDILIVTHTVVIKTILSIIKNTKTENIWDPPFIHDTSLTVIEYENGKFSISYAAKTPHLVGITEGNRV